MTKGEIITFGLLATACLVAVVRVAASPRDSATAYLVRHCEEAQGEWLYGEEQPTCIRADGTWMIFDSQVHSFVPKPELALAAEPAPMISALATDVDCGLEQPQLTDYPAVEPRLTSSVRPDFSTLPAALHYRTAITKDVTRGVNFAGHYVFAEWGCGIDCYGMAVVDARTGAIQGYGLKSTQLFSYQEDSRLIGLNTPDGLAYFVLNADGVPVQVCGK